MAQDVQDQDEKKKQGRLLLVVVLVVIGVGLAIFSAVRSFDNGPHVVGVLGDGPPPRGKASIKNNTDTATNAEPTTQRGQ